MSGGEKHSPSAAGIPEALSSVMGVGQDDLNVESSGVQGGDETVIHYGKVSFVCRYRASADSAAVLDAVFRLKEEVERYGSAAVPLLVVPFMGGVGKRICRDHGTSWFDLSGNADIEAKGLKILILGRSNKYKRRGRPSSVFAPKSSRIVRWLLVWPEKRFTEEQLSLRAFARDAGVDPGLTSRVLSRLEHSGYIARDSKSGVIRVIERDRLLDDWRAAYDFDRHTILTGHVASRSGEELFRDLGRAIDQSGFDYAATGLGVAWYYTRFASFRLATFYVSPKPSEGLLDEIGFRQTQRGANTWLVIPNDDGVLQNRGKTDLDFFCVDPVQAYLDLFSHPERGAEMAPLLRRQIDIARRIRSRESLESIYGDYREEGITKEHIDHIRKVIHSSVEYNSPLPDWNDLK